MSIYKKAVVVREGTTKEGLWTKNPEERMRKRSAEVPDSVDSKMPDLPLLRQVSIPKALPELIRENRTYVYKLKKRIAALAVDAIVCGGWLWETVGAPYVCIHQISNPPLEGEAHLVNVKSNKPLRGTGRHPETATTSAKFDLRTAAPAASGEQEKKKHGGIGGLKSK